MLKRFLKIVLFTLLLVLITGVGTSYAEETTPSSTSFSSICDQIGKPGPWADYPDCAASPDQCISKENGFTPINCTYLEEPIGGEPGYDMFKITCTDDPDNPDKPLCVYTLWHGEAIVGDERVVQAILTYESGKDFQGPFSLLYNYIGVVYKFLSGIIVAFVVLVSIIGGIEMTISGGDQEKFRKGKERIIKAMVGMVLWFLASLVLYTINPTFFAF